MVRILATSSALACSATDGPCAVLAVQAEQAEADTPAAWQAAATGKPAA